MRGRSRRRGGVLAGVAVSVLALTGLTVTAVPSGAAPSGAGPVVVGVDHADPANQIPPTGRVFEYTTFFTRDISVHQGQTVDFRAAPGSFHIVGLSKDEPKARRVYPVGYTDKSDGEAPNGGRKVGLGPSNYPITGGSLDGGGTVDFSKPNGPPDCGVASAGQAPCTFKGGEDVEVAGPNPGFGSTGAPAPADWNITINAPVGTYKYFCFIHPGMSGTLHVVGSHEETTTQAQINAASARQFAADRASALATESSLNKVVWTGGRPGTRTYWFHLGAGAADNEVAIDEMLPNTKTLPGGSLKLDAGDKVAYVLSDTHNVHSVFFHDTGNLAIDNAVSPFVFDCGKTLQNPGAIAACTEKGEGPELIGDPGNAEAGVVLRHPTPSNLASIPDAGVLFGTGYGIAGSLQSWSVATVQGETKSGLYTFHCTVHDWMHGSLSVS
jgi:plastocyanin